jgi:HlyD family secretion protein
MTLRTKESVQEMIAATERLSFSSLWSPDVRSSMRACLFIAVAILVGVGIGGGGLVLYGQWAGRPADADHSFRKSRSPAGRDQVAALARLRPGGEVIDLGGLMGDRLGTLLVEEGIQVKKGDVLGYLESHAERQADLDAVTAQLAEAQRRLEAESAYADTQIREARVGVRSAGEINPLEVQAQQAKVRLLETEVAAAQKDLERMRGVSSPGVIPEQKLDQQIQLVCHLTQELKAARAELARSQAAESIQLEQARARLAGAEAALRRVKASSQIESLRMAQAQARARLDRTVLRAPRDGRVLVVHCRPGERVDQKPILQLGDTGVMYAVAEVYETDLQLVKPGQKARVRSPALPAELSGTTERIGWSVGKNEVLHVDPTASADARVVKVWIRLDPAEGIDHLNNLQVDVLIDTSAPPTGSASSGQGEQSDG